MFFCSLEIVKKSSISTKKNFPNLGDFFSTYGRFLIPLFDGLKDTWTALINLY